MNHLLPRRTFLRRAALGMTGACLLPRSFLQASPSGLSPVAVTSGTDRREILLRGLELMKAEILRAAHGRRILLKPNMVSFNNQFGGNPELSSSHVEQLEIVLDWFHHLGFRDIVVAESTPNGMTMEGFETLAYTELPRRRRVFFKDLNQEGYEEVAIAGSAGTVRISRMILDPATFVVSLAKLKTHNNVALTFSGKNVFMGSPVIDVKSFHGDGGRSDKSRMHGDRNQDLHDNLFRLAHRGVRPDLAVIDGFEGMEGRGPIWGTGVPSRAAVVSTDWLAADRVCCELTGFEEGLQRQGLEPEMPAYLRYCAQAGLGAFTFEQMELRGESPGDLRRVYQLHNDIAGMVGMDPDAPIYRSGATWVNPLDRHGGGPGF